MVKTFVVKVFGESVFKAVGMRMSIFAQDVSEDSHSRISQAAPRAGYSVWNIWLGGAHSNTHNHAS